MLSILIPTYNYEVIDLVGELQKQASHEGITFEIIVVDDASPQKERVKQNEQINSFPNCKYIVQKENLGRTATRQHLATLASFEKLLFLDADVLPLNDSFIASYVPYFHSEIDVICGGITYNDQIPPKDQMLRYVYGKQREIKSAEERNKKNHIIVSANFLIRKDLFFKINSIQENFYGDDLILSQNLKKEKSDVLHIDNPLIHMGLESSEEFIKKSRNAIESIVAFEKDGRIETDVNRLQRLYKKARIILPIVTLFFRMFRSSILKNLKSKKPSMLLLDLYRLNYYTKLKSMKNA